MDFLDRLDPEVRAVFADLPAVDLSDIAAARATLTKLLALTQSDAAHSRNVILQDWAAPALGHAPEVRLRTYLPAKMASPIPCLYWIHGGGHLRGHVEQDDLEMEHIVKTVGCAVASVDWRRAPEHPFPAEMDDCYAGLTWIHEHAAELGIDPWRIAVGGASSGGGSAAGLALLARDMGHPPICFQLLIEPMLDDRNVTASSYAITEPKVWNRQSNRIAWQAYLGTAQGTSDVSVYAAPARANNLAGLPPAFITVGDLDLFFDEDIEYARRLQRAEVPVEMHVYPGAIHGFQDLAPTSQLARRSIRHRDEALRRAFQL